MSGRQCQPGDVAMASLPGNEFMVVRHSGDPDYWSAANGTWPRSTPAEMCDYRPLLIIDPEDREQMLAFAQAYCDATPSVAQIPEMISGRLVRASRLMLEPPAPPKPDEPSHLGMVEAQAFEIGFREWVRHVDPHNVSARQCWWSRGTVARWEDLTDITILSPGITPDEPEAESDLPPDLIRQSDEVARWFPDHLAYRRWMDGEWGPFDWSRAELEKRGYIRETPHGTAALP